MAKILGGGTFGELRGKLGSLVFSRNASSAYVRAYVKPVDANTTAQSLARGQFSNVVQRWHNLTDANKQLWATYAQNKNFSSGVNAFVSLQSRVQNNFRLSLGGGISTGLDGNEVVTTGAFTVSDLPPDYNSFIAPLIITEISTATGEFDESTSELSVNLTLQLDSTFGTSGPGEPLEASAFVENFSPAGVTAYLSLPNVQENQFYNNPQFLKLGAFNPVTDAEPASESPIASTTLDLAITKSLTGHKFAVIASSATSGFFSKITLFWEGMQGEKQLIGSKNIRFTF